MPERHRPQAGKPLSRAEVDRRISDLRRHLIPPRTTREDLDQPLDAGVRVDHEGNRHKVILVVDGVDVSWATVVDFEQQIGADVVRMGGIASVGTHDDHRFRGYSRCLLENSLRWMKQNGYHTTMLYGIPSYYPKFGYAKAFPQVRFRVAVRDAECADPGDVSFLPFAVADHKRALLQMYHATNRGRNGITRRDPDQWNGFSRGLAWNSGTIAEMAFSPQGKPLGYIVFNDQHLTATVIETGFTTPEVFPALLHRAAKAAWEQRLSHIEFELPEDDAFMGYCQSYGLHKQTDCARDGAGMVRLIDAVKTLTAVAGELAGRMKDPGSLNLRTNLDSLSLSWEAAEMTIGTPIVGAPTIRLPQWALAQLLYGFQTPTALAAERWIRGSRTGLQTLEQMFPARAHYQYAADHF